MLRMFLKTTAIAVLLMSCAVYGQQSLGDIAREYKDKEAAQDASGTRPKVITNKDLPASPNAGNESDGSRPTAIARNTDDPFDHQSANQPFANHEFANREFGNHPFANRPSPNQRYAEQRFGDQNAAEQWKRRIQMQETRIASLQARIDQVTAMAHSAGGTAQSEGPYNRYQARQMERLGQMQQLLDEQRRQLDFLQDAARRAGMHTSVYDP